ncbi:MAG: hypothetical protein ACK54J_24390 [Pseudanabaena sp.]
MGITPSALLIISDMANENMFSVLPKKIIELGTQEVHCRDSDLIDHLFDSFCVNQDQRQLISFGDKARNLFEVLGFAYECVDLDGAEKTQNWDINTVKCPKEFYEQFALTTNHGTSEHLIDQKNAFQLLHDLTMVGGYMMHTVPCTGQVNHGFFSYSPILFSSLAKANNYDIEYFFLTDFNELVLYEGDIFPDFCYIVIVMKKTQSKEFQLPLQVWDRSNLCYVDSLKA